MPTIKKISFLLVFAFLTVVCFSQQTSAALPPYKRFPTVPPIKLLMTDSSTVFTKDQLDRRKSVVVMLFSPDCEHCQHETEEIIKNMDALKNTQILMATSMPFDKMKEFYKRYKLNRFGNIVVGRDLHFMLPPFYNVRNLPFMAIYNKKKELVSVFEGNMPIDKLISELRK